MTKPEPAPSMERRPARPRSRSDTTPPRVRSSVFITACEYASSSRWSSSIIVVVVVIVVRCSSESDQAMAQALAHRLGPRRGADLGQDLADVVLRGVRRDAQHAGDVAVRQ